MSLLDRMRGKTMREITKVEPIHGHLEYDFDDWLLVFSNGDYINTCNNSAWNEDYNNFLDVAYSYFK